MYKSYQKKEKTGNYDSLIIVSIQYVRPPASEDGITKPFWIIAYELTERVLEVGPITATATKKLTARLFISDQKKWVIQDITQ